MKREEVAAFYRDLDAYAGKTVTVCGWARSIRDSKALGFIDLNDGTCFKGVQVVFEADKLENYKEIAAQNVGAALVVTGTLLATPEAKQPFEIHATNIEVEGPLHPGVPPAEEAPHRGVPADHRPPAAPDQPVQRGLPHPVRGGLRHPQVLPGERVCLRSHAHYHRQRLRGRRGDVPGDHPGPGGPAQGEDGAVDYKKDFFEKPTSLTVSGQLEAECMAMAFGKVYTFGPTFRAERSYTQRHAAEFWMIEPEMAFADLTDDMDVIEAAIKYVINYVMEACPQDMAFCNQFVDKGLLERLRHVASSDFVRVSYTEAVKILEPHNDEFEYKVSWGCDLQTEHEKFLTEKHFGKPVFVTDYPKEIKAFYMRLNDDNKTVAATDLLVPGIGELVGASQREERYDVLLQRIHELGLNEEDYWWYLDLRRFGGNKHAGFGIGFERLVMYLTGIANIRDVLPFPRTTGSAEF